MVFRGGDDGRDYSKKVPVLCRTGTGTGRRDNNRYSMEIHWFLRPLGSFFPFLVYSRT